MATTAAAAAAAVQWLSSLSPSVQDGPSEVKGETNPPCGVCPSSAPPSVLPPSVHFCSLLIQKLNELCAYLA